MPSPATDLKVASDTPLPTPAGSGGSFDLDRALAALSGRKHAAIYMHDNPDPDALAAAFGLARLLERELGARATLVVGGIVGRAQNRAMVEVLEVPLQGEENAAAAGGFDIVAVVDSQPGTGNNSLPPGRPVDIVVDHHPLRPESAAAPWCDVRVGLGATSTIILEYLRRRGVPLDPALATGLFFALRTETRDLGREATPAEREAYLHLVPLVDHDLLFRVAHPKVPREYFQTLDQALRAARCYDDVVTVNLGALAYPDLVAELADLFLSFERTRYVLCCGRYQGRVFLSLRTDASDRRAGTLMRQLIDAQGAAGGHGTMAGGRLHATVTDDDALAAAWDPLVRRFLTMLGRASATPVALIAP